MKELREEAHLVGKGIKVFGGGFMNALLHAMEYADNNNLLKIKNTWNEEWYEYLKMGKIVVNRSKKT